MKGELKQMLGILGYILISVSCAHEKVTSYPVMGLASIDPGVKDSPASYLDIINPEEIGYYKLAHGGAIRIVRDIAKAHNYSIKPVVYTGGFTIQPEYVPMVEQKFRAAIAMSPLAKLSGNIDEKVTTIKLNMGEDPEWPFHASTAEVSSGKGDNKFCFWVRIGEEFLKVISTDSVRKTLTVLRGFDNTLHNVHKKGDIVFGPVYLGNRKTIGTKGRSQTWPVSGQGIRYALDPSIPLMHQFKADFVIEKIKEGYAGIWWDTFQAFTFNLCDPIGRGGYGTDGNSLLFWDFKNNCPYTHENLLEAMKSQMRGVRNITLQAIGINPYLTANSITGKYEFMKSVIESGKLLDGYCFENSFISQIDEAKNVMSDQKKENLKFSFSAKSQTDWEQKVTDMIHSAREGRETYSMIGPAGFISGYFNPSLPNYERLERFGWSSFLLTVEKSRTTMFGSPITFTKNKKGEWQIVPLADYFFYHIGDPLESKTLKEYQYGEDLVWMRIFENGIVIVSRLAEGKQIEVKLPGTYKNPATRGKIEKIIMTGTDGIVLAWK